MNRLEQRIHQPREPEREPTPHAIDRTFASIALDRERLQRALDRRCLEDGLADAWDARVVAATASTNSDLLDEARAGRTFSRPAVLAAELQTAGRGRLGRTWVSARGASLTASYALNVARPLSGLEGITLVCGLAVRDALARHGLRVDLKWPNDVLVDGRKLAGILVEAHALAASTIVIVGVGVNVVPRDPDTADNGIRALAAIDLHSAGCPLEDRNRLAADLALALGARLARFAESGFAAFASEWNEVDAFRNQPVSLGMSGPGTKTDVSVVGIERGVDASGRLSIEIDGQHRKFIAGDLTLRTLAAA